MKKLILFLLLMASVQLVAQNKFVSTPLQWYSPAQSIAATPVAKTTFAAGDTGFSTSFSCFPYDSTTLNINALKGDTLGIIIRVQFGYVSSAGQSWGPFTVGLAALDTLSYITAAADYYGTSFSWSAPMNKEAKMMRFVAIGTSASARLNGSVAEKWLLNTQSFALQAIKP